jgi:aminoglycoside phosphotransferase (APT) family kinase protein
MTDVADQPVPDQTPASDRVLDAATLTRLLRVDRPGVEVESVEVLGATDGSASRLRLAVTYSDGCDASLPPTIFVKRNLERFSFPSEMYSTEVRIYRDVLPGLDVERPAVYAIDALGDDITFTLLMEDLSQRHGARLGIVTEPNSVDEVAALLDTLASVHAAYWGGDRLERELPWLTPPLVNAPMRFWRDIGPRLTRRHVERGHRAPLVDRSIWTDDALWGGYERLLEVMDSGPHTLLHGDVHAGNVYYVDGVRGGLLDWQLALRGCWALDVTYILTTALDQEQLAGNERSLIEHYLSALAVHGVTPPPMDDAWHRYRCHALYGVLMWLITPDGVHTDEAQIGYLTRCLTAAERLRTLAALGG